jgi:hypothetical protein
MRQRWGSTNDETELMLRSKPTQFAIGSGLVLQPLDRGGGLRLVDPVELDRRA